MLLCRDRLPKPGEVPTLGPLGPVCEGFSSHMFFALGNKFLTPSPPCLTEEQRAKAKAKMLPFRKRWFLQGSLRLTGGSDPWRKTRTATHEQP